MTNAHRNTLISATAALVLVASPSALADLRVSLNLPKPPSPREVLRHLPAPPMLQVADRGRGQRYEDRGRGYDHRDRRNDRNRNDRYRSDRERRDRGRSDGYRYDGYRNDRNRNDGRWNYQNRHRDDRYRRYDNRYRRDRYRDHGLRVWIDGSWVLPPFPGAIWIEGYWDVYGYWVPGRWVRPW